MPSFDKVRLNDAPVWLIQLANWVLRHIKDKDLSVKRLREVSGKSQSTLTRNSIKYLGVTPMKAIRYLKLFHIRRDLCTLQGATVLNVMMEYNIGNHGEMAQLYYKVYGEQPHHTRRRTRNGYECAELKAVEKIMAELMLQRSKLS